MSDERYTPKIRNALDNKRTTSSVLEFKFDEKKLREENRYRVEGEAFPKDIKSFNWGACIIPYIWGPFNNSPIALLSLIVGFVPYIGIVLSVVFSLYCGYKGNEWAWINKEWSDLREFHRVQKQWAIWAIGIEVLIMMCVGIAAYILFLKTSGLDSLDSLLQMY